MLNILFGMNGVFHKGGIESVLLNIYSNINREKFHIDFLLHIKNESEKQNEMHDYLQKNGSKIYFVTSRGSNPVKNKIEIHNILKSTRYDIIHSHMDAAGYFLLKEAKKQNINVRIAHSHNTAQLLSNNSIRSMVHKAILEYARFCIRKCATHYIACSDLAGQWLFGKKLCQTNRYLLFNNSIDCKKYIFDSSLRTKKRVELGIQDKFVIGHIGRFHIQKNHNFLLDIFYEVYKSCPDSILLLIGDGELKSDINKKVSELGLDKHVIFLGIRTDISDLLQAMDVFVFPSLFEGLPVVLIEAQANGLRVITSSNIDIKSKIVNELAFLDLSLDAKIWANEVLKFQSGYTRRNTYLEIMQAGYDSSHNIAILEDFYESCKHV